MISSEPHLSPEEVSRRTFATVFRGFDPTEVRAYLRRVSDELGVGKPDPALFELSARTAGVAPGDAVMVGDRLDYDVRPAKGVGMRAIWMLRGEAPDEPTPTQLAEADAAIRGLDELPEALERLGREARAG